MQTIDNQMKITKACKEIALRSSVEIKGHRYVQVEGWQTIATVYGFMPCSRDVERVYDKDTFIGWNAVGELRNKLGNVVFTAEGFVGIDEKQWSSADEYACRSMDQTRAISKVCRGAFAHIIVMMDAGLDTTPSEEVPRNGFKDSNNWKKRYYEKVNIYKEFCETNNVKPHCYVLVKTTELTEDLANKNIDKMQQNMKEIKARN